MNLRIAGLFISLLLTGWLSTGQAAESVTKYRSLFDIKHMFCAIKTNGVLGQDNRSSAVDGHGFATSSTASMLMMENGENDISVEVGALNWFNPEITKTKQKAEFNPAAYCNLSLVMIDSQSRETISNIDISIDNDGFPVAKQLDVVRTENVGVKVEPGFISEESYAPAWFPVGMKLYEFTRKVQVSGLPEWKWTKAEAYTDTPEQRKLLQDAYMQLWQAFNQRDMVKIKGQLQVSLDAWAYATDSTADNILKSYDFDSDFKSAEFKMVPINWDNYQIQVMNKGRMVELRNKSDPDFTPITLSTEDGLSYYAPTFSLIDGKFVAVL